MSECTLIKFDVPFGRSQILFVSKSGNNDSFLLNKEIQHYKVVIKHFIDVRNEM